jgi:hypothetical protein
MTALKSKINQNNIYKITYFLTEDVLPSWQRRLFLAI